MWVRCSVSTVEYRVTVFSIMVDEAEDGLPNSLRLNSVCRMIDGVDGGSLFRVLGGGGVFET